LTSQIPDDLRETPATATVEGMWVNFFFNPEQESSRTLIELASEIEKDFVSWQRTVKITRSRIEALARSDELGGLGSNNNSVRMESQNYENVKVLKETLLETQTENRKLQNQLAYETTALGKALEREQYWRDYSSKQLERMHALRDSKLGRLQTYLWKEKAYQRYRIVRHRSSPS